MVDEIRDPGSVRRADHECNSRQRRQLSGRALGVAAGHYNLRRRVVGGDSPDRLARRGIRPRSHAAGIHDVDVGGIARTDGLEIASVVHEGANRFRVVLVQPAPEGAVRDTFAHGRGFRSVRSFRCRITLRQSDLPETDSPS